MNMKKTILAAALLMLLSAFVQAQPIYRFTVKIGIDCESVDSLGGLDKVRANITDMFTKVNKAFNYTRQFDAVYDFVVDWDAFYVFEGISKDEVFKPHPDHDYLVIMDGFKNDPKETGGGWYGADIQTIYHARTHTDHFNSPFEKNAIDGIIHEFGHARGMPDIYAMQVYPDKNPIAPIACYGERCIMNYPYGETLWSDYAVNMLNLSKDKRVEIDELVAAMCPEKINITVLDPADAPVKDAKVILYPVPWYSYSVSDKALAEKTTDAAGLCVLPGDVYGKSDGFGLSCPNIFVKAEYNGLTAYGWLPLYNVQNAAFYGNESYDLTLRLKSLTTSKPFEFKLNQ
jgi:hypothetical protein